MSGISIGSNSSSLRAQRQLARASDGLSSIYEKLSSGQRINRSSDDAAGLGVASSLRADARIYSQGIKNLNDGVSALAIADGALQSLSDIVVRLQEMAEQSASGTVSSKQRASLDGEAQALAKEYFRISQTTDFNGLPLFDGTIQGLSLQAGYGGAGSLLSSLGGDLGTGTFGGALLYETQSACSDALAVAELNGDGVVDIVTAGLSGALVLIGNGDGTFKPSTSYETESSRSQAVSLSDLNGDGVLDLVTAGFGGGGYATIRLGAGDGTFGASLSYQTETNSSRALSVSDVNGDDILDMVSAGVDGTSGIATIRLGNGDGTFRAALSYQTEDSECNALAMGDVNRDGALDLITAGAGGGGYATIRLGNGDGTFKASLSYETERNRSYAISTHDVDGDGHLDLISGGSDTFGYNATIRLGNGDGTFRAKLSFRSQSNYTRAVSMTDTNGDGALDLVTAGRKSGGGGYACVALGNGDATFRSAISFQTHEDESMALCMSDVNEDGVPDLVTAGEDYMTGSAIIRLANTQDGISPILPFSLKTLAEARQSLSMLEKTADRLSLQRAQIGAFQSRIHFALNTLGTSVLQYRGAESRIADVDVAEEVSTLLRTQILEQAASAVLAQANRAPSLALMFLK